MRQWRSGAPTDHRWDEERSLATASRGAEKQCLFCIVLVPHRAPCQFVSSAAPGNSSCLSTLRTGGISANARAPTDEGCSALRSATNKALHGFAD